MKKGRNSVSALILITLVIYVSIFVVLRNTIQMGRYHLLSLNI